jgi:hypothetical protein
MQNEYTLTHSSIARPKTKVRITSASTAIATLTAPHKKQKLNKRQLSYIPVCWQCGAEKGLLTLHSDGVLYVCHSCGGE